MPAGTPDDWLYSDWRLITRTLEKFNLRLQSGGKQLQ